MTESVYIRASSLGALLDCPARWIAIYRENRRAPTSQVAQLGKAIHAGTAHFDRERLDGSPASVEAATQCAVETFERPDEEVAAMEDDAAVDKVKRVAASLTGRYCTLYAPTADFAAVEVGVNRLEISDLRITLGGTADRVRRTPDGMGVSDLKTGRAAVNARGEVNVKGHAVQLGVYQLLAEAALKRDMTAPAQIIGLQTNLTPEKQRIAAGEIAGVREVLVGDADQQGVLEVAARLAHGELVFGNPRSMMCSEKFCPAFKTCFWRR